MGDLNKSWVETNKALLYFLSLLLWKTKMTKTNLEKKKEFLLAYSWRTRVHCDGKDTEKGWRAGAWSWLITLHHHTRSMKLADHTSPHRGSMKLADHISSSHRKPRKNMKWGQTIKAQSLLQLTYPSSQVLLPKGSTIFPDSITSWGPKCLNMWAYGRCSSFNPPYINKYTRSKCIGPFINT